MKKRYCRMLLAGALLFALTGMKAAAEDEEPFEPVSAKIAVVAPDVTEEYWDAFLNALLKETEELNEAGCQIEVNELYAENGSRLEMIENIETAIDDGADYLIFASPNAQTYTNALQEAADEGMRIIYADTQASLQGTLFAADDFTGGCQAADTLIEMLQKAGVGKGMIGVLSAMKDDQQEQDRYEGFASVMEDTDFTVSEPAYSEGDEQKAEEILTDYIDKGVIALYATGRNATESMALPGEENDIIKIGWDWSPDNKEAVEEGTISVLITGSPELMGAYCVDAVVAIGNNEDLNGLMIDTGISLFEAGDEVVYEELSTEEESELE